jgi:hypothetical protein
MDGVQLTSYYCEVSITECPPLFEYPARTTCDQHIIQGISGSRY